MAFAGLPLAVLDGVRQDGPGQHVRCGHADTRKHAQDEQNPKRHPRIERGHRQQDNRKESDANNVGLALVVAAGDPLPDGQGEDGNNEDGRHDQVALRFALHHILDIEQQDGLDDADRDPGEQVDPKAEHERAVGPGGFDRLPDAGL